VSEEEIRKLAAIMFTDMVGYSALSQRDDKLAVELLEEHRELLRKIFPRFHGTEIKTIGDAFLIEFNSALEAAQCAIEIQRALAHRNHDVAAERRVELKIGIHIGDVVHRGGDVYGDGVNIASRIEQLAGAGGICVSMDVERQIRNAVETRFEKLAPTELKNISVPMELFRIVLPWERKTNVSGQKSKARKGSAFPRVNKFALIGAVALLLIGIGWWFVHRANYTTSTLRSADENLRHDKQNEAATGSGKVTGPIPEKSIAVLPFENLSSDKDNAYFAEGIQDEILTRLAKIGALKVISRTSTAHFATSPQNLPEIARQLGVANILEGSAQKAGDAVHVNVQLIRAATDDHVWAESYNRKLDDVFGVEGEVASAVADQLKARLTGAEEKAVTEKPTENPAAYDAYLRGISIEQTRTDDAAAREAVANYATAVRLDPNFALAWARLAILRSVQYFDGFDLEINTPAAVKEAADKALQLQPQLGESFVAQGVYRYRVLRDFRGALESYGEALKRLPNSSLVLEQTAHVERRLGQWDAAEKHYRAALELDPRNVDDLTNLGEFLQAVRKFPEAQNIFDRLLQVSPSSDFALASKAAIFQAEGQLDDAARLLALTKKDSPDVYVNVVKFWQLDYERKFEKAVAFVQSSRVPEFTQDARCIAVLAFCQEWAGHEEEAGATFGRAVKAIKPTPDAVVPVDSRNLGAFLALSYAGLGQKEQAIQEANRAVSDYADDAVNKPYAEMCRAVIEARLGDADSAISALPHLLEVPGGTTTGLLRLDPWWDPLRNDPRFEKLCQGK
jgi:class 3 adenylate cyclase/TolB-like protein/Tfp pilus assembly protein PilF